MIKQYYSNLKTAMSEEESLEFGLRKIDEAINYFLDEIKHNDLTSEKYKKRYKYLNYVEHLLIIASTITGCLNFYICFISLCSCWYCKFSSAVGIKTCAITAGINEEI